MDRPDAIPSYVPSKTARGLMAVSGRPGVLPRELLVVLAAVDGRSSLDEIARRPDVHMSHEEVEAALARLIEGGYVRRLAPPDGDVERERLMEEAAKVAAVEAAAAAGENDGADDPAGGADVETLLAEFSAFVNGAEVPKTLQRGRARQLLRFAADRFAEHHRAMLAVDAAREQAVQQYAVLRQEIERVRSASGDAQTMPDARRLFEAVLAREQQARAQLRDAHARIAELEGQGDAVLEEELRRREGVEQRLAETVAQLAAVQGELATLRETGGAATELRARVDAAEQRVVALESELAEARAHVERSDAALAAAEARWRDREAELERQHAQLAEEADQLVKNTWQRGQDDLLRERRERNAEVKRLVEAIQRHATVHADLEADRDEHRTRLAATHGELEAARGEMARLRTELEAASQSAERARRESVAAFAEREDLRQREQAAQRAAEEARAEAQAHARRAAAAIADIEPLREALLEIDREGVTLSEMLRRTEHALSAWGLKVASALLRDRNEREARAAHLTDAAANAAALLHPAASAASGTSGASATAVEAEALAAVTPSDGAPGGASAPANAEGQPAGLVDTQAEGGPPFPVIRHEGLLAD